MCLFEKKWVKEELKQLNPADRRLDSDLVVGAFSSFFGTKASWIECRGRMYWGICLEQVQAKTEYHTDRIEQSQLVSVKKDVDVPLSAATVPGNDESDPTLIVPVLGSLEADSFRNLRVIYA